MTSAETPDTDPADQPESVAETTMLMSETLSLPMPASYTEMDRYRDFVKVFKGSEEGQRVLRVLISWGRLFRPVVRTAGPIDPLRMAIMEGERNFAQRILIGVSVEPKQPTQRPTRGRSKPKEA